MVVFPAPKSLTIPLCFLPRPEVLLSLATLGAGAVVTGTESLDFRVHPCSVVFSPAISCAAGRAGVVGSTIVTMALEQGGKTEAAPWP